LKNFGKKAHLYSKKLPRTLEFIRYFEKREEKK